jgi:uncharacterized protein DUF3592
MRFFYYNYGPSYQSLTTLMRSRITYWLMIGLGLLFGVWFVLEDEYVHEAPSKFQKAACVVEDSDIEVHGRNRWGAPTSFSPVVTFTFAAADGQEHTVTGYRLCEDGMSMAAAAEVADRYEPGQETTCYYDPANPDNAVLSLEANRHTLGWLVFLAVLLLVGGVAGLVFVEFVVKRAERPPVVTPDVLEEALRPLAPAAPSDGLRAAPAAAWQEGLQKQA